MRQSRGIGIAAGKPVGRLSTDEFPREDDFHRARPMKCFEETKNRFGPIAGIFGLFQEPFGFKPRNQRVFDDVLLGKSLKAV